MGRRTNGLVTYWPCLAVLLSEESLVMDKLNGGDLGVNPVTIKGP
jgi:hypothetical protein